MIRRRLLQVGGEGGSTLIELICVLAILVTVLSAVVDGYVSATRVEMDRVVKTDAEQNARAALEMMRRDIHCASGASTSNSGATLTLVQPSSTPCAAPSTAFSSIAWCTTGSAGRYQLRRQVVTSGTATCSATSMTRADYLSNNLVWAGTVPGCASSGRWPTVPVDIAVAEKGKALSTKTYELTDAIALRNAASTCA